MSSTLHILEMSWCNKDVLNAVRKGGGYMQGWKGMMELRIDMWGNWE